MLVKTKYFGEIEIDKEQIITFDEGIFGFSECQKYTILFDNNVLCWLQSVEDKDVVLPMIVTPLVFPEYAPEIDDELILSIGDLNQEDLVLYNIIVVPKEIEKMTTNLKAPIIINSKTNKGMQIILDSDKYSIKHNLYKHLKALDKKVGE